MPTRFLFLLGFCCSLGCGGSPDNAPYEAYLHLKEGEIRQARALVKKFPHIINHPVGEFGGRTLLHGAVDFQHEDFVAFLIRQGADLDAGDRDQIRPLHLAVERNNLDVLSTLIRSRATVDAQNSSGQTPLHWACYKYNKHNQNLPLIQALLKAGAAADKKDGEGTTPFLNLVTSGDEGAIQVLVAANVSMTSVNNFGENALVMAVLSKNQQLVPVLRKLGVPVDLAAATVLGELKTVLAELQAHSPKLSGYSHGSTLLHLAVRSNQTESARAILSTAPALLDMRDKWGYTALHLAAVDDARDVGTLLINHRASANMQDNAGDTPAHLAIHRQHRAFTLMLLKSGANVQTGNNNSQTLLHMAAGINDVELVKELLRLGANPQQADKFGRTPLDWVDYRSPVAALMRSNREKN